jgi:chemotaxis protein CheX
MLAVTSEDIASIVSSVFEATFALAIEQVPPEAVPVASMSSSLVGISGGWDGAVIIDCSPGVSVSLAAIMFGLPVNEVGRDHVEDALGELANMIGGNFKALLESSCSLSLPTVVEGRDFRVRVPGATIVRELHFAVDGGHLRVFVAERGGGTAAGDGARAAA